MKIVLLVLLIPSVLLAAGGGHDGAIPWAKVVQQLYNLSFLVGVIVVYSLPQIRKSLQEKRNSFISESTKAEAIKKEAEVNVKDLQGKITELESTFLKTVENTKKEAEYLKSQIESESMAESMRLSADAETQIKSEVLKVQKELKEKLLTEAMSEFNKELDSNSGGTIKSQLKQKFIHNIETAKI